MDHELKEKLLFPRRGASVFLSAAETRSADEYCKPYIEFLNAAKTEREAVRAAIAMAEKAGFVPWKSGSKARRGDKFYFSRRGKALVLCVIGKKSFAEGVSIVASHVDSPRLDLKMKPVYEDSSMAFLDTHYYGGIKPYQWTGIPLALHGFAVRADGTEINISIGEEKGEPVFFAADLLPHLADGQMGKPAKDAVKAESLDLLAGLRSAPGESGAGSVRLNVLRLLHEKYGLTEKDLVSAEISAVPAFGASDMGLDRSMVGSYGQDDKICVYPALTALLSLEEPEYTACAVLADKEETGSNGISGMQSPFFFNFVAELAEAASAAENEVVRQPSGFEQPPLENAISQPSNRRFVGEKLQGLVRQPTGLSNKSNEVSRSGVNTGKILSNSFCLSADVNASWYPLYREVFDDHGEARLNHGVVLFRYWGRGGKDNTNDADAQTTAALIKILDEEKILWQTGEGGKVDAGSSGTLSRFFANQDIPSIDLGVPLLSMHSPFEGASKTDIYMAHRAFAAFFRRK